MTAHPLYIIVCIYVYVIVFTVDVAVVLFWQYSCIEKALNGVSMGKHMLIFEIYTMFNVFMCFCL